MKRVLFLFCIYFIACSFAPTRNFFIQKIRVGKFHYSIYKEAGYDSGLNTEYFVVYNEYKKQMVSGYLWVKHNDTAYVEGSYSFTPKKFVEKECYHYPRSYGKFADSSISIFYPNRQGNLVLKKHKDFYKGKVTEYRY